MSYGDFGDLQLSVLDVLWTSGPSSVREVQELLSIERSVAYTTVLTVLRSLEKRGLVDHENDAGSRMFRYRARVTKDEVRTDLIANLLAKLFSGSPILLVHHIVAQGWLGQHDLAEIANSRF